MNLKPPTSDGFQILATGYRDAGDAALDKIRQDDYSGFAALPCVFLYFRSIELALKAMLMKHGVSIEDIKNKLGHRIDKLVGGVEQFMLLKPLGLNDEDLGLLDRFSSEYSGKWFEYSDDFWQEVPDLEELKSLAHRICDLVP